MKFLLILLLSFFSFSAKAQKLDHDYKTDSIYVMDAKTSIIKEQRAHVATIRFSVDSVNGSTVKLSSGKTINDLRVVQPLVRNKPIDEFIISAYMVEDIKTLKTYVFILTFDKKNNLQVVGIADKADTIGFTIKE